MFKLDISGAIRLISKKMPEILTSASLIGICSTVGCTIHDTICFSEKVKHIDTKNKKEVCKTVISEYRHTFFSAIFTGGLVVYSHIYNKNRYFALATAYNALCAGVGTISKASIIDEFDRETGPDDEELYYDMYGDIYFNCSENKLLWAIIQINKHMQTYGYVTLNDWYRYLGLKEKWYGESVGWDMDSVGEFYNTSWIEPYIERSYIDDSMVCNILFMNPPPNGEYLLV